MDIPLWVYFTEKDISVRRPFVVSGEGLSSMSKHWPAFQAQVAKWCSLDCEIQRIAYKDTEGDVCIISSDLEFQEAVNHFLEHKEKMRSWEIMVTSVPKTAVKDKVVATAAPKSGAEVKVPVPSDEDKKTCEEIVPLNSVKKEVEEFINQHFVAAGKKCTPEIVAFIEQVYELRQVHIEMAQMRESIDKEKYEVIVTTLRALVSKLELPECFSDCVKFYAGLISLQAEVDVCVKETKCQATYDKWQQLEERRSTLRRILVQEFQKALNARLSVDSPPLKGSVVLCKNTRSQWQEVKVKWCRFLGESKHCIFFEGDDKPVILSQTYDYPNPNWKWVPILYENVWMTKLCLHHLQV